MLAFTSSREQAILLLHFLGAAESIVNSEESDTTANFFVEYLLSVYVSRFLRCLVLAEEPCSRLPYCFIPCLPISLAEEYPIFQLLEVRDLAFTKAALR